MKQPGWAWRRYALWVLAGLGLATVGVYGALAVVDHLESDPDFCNACHLPGGTPLHQDKLRIARALPPLDLTAAHMQTSQGRPRGQVFSCAECHRGYGWSERSHVLWNSALNTVRYGVGDFQEPERILAPIANAGCERCHGEALARVDISAFHGIKAHRDQQTVLCTSCHLAHAAPDAPESQVQRSAGAAEQVCRRCHKGQELAPPIADLLQRYRTRLMPR